MPPKRKLSSLWNHFIEEAGAKRAKCVYCTQIIAISNSSIGSLRRHLNSKHPTINITVQTLNEIENSSEDRKQEDREESLTQFQHQENQNESKKTPSTSMVSAKKQYSSMENYIMVKKNLSVSKVQQLDTQLMLMIANGYHALRIVDEEEFRKFVQMLNPGYTLPTRKTLSESILTKVYNIKLEQVQNKIKQAVAICITTDGWTLITTDGYIAVTAHFIDSESKLCSLMLGCVEYEERHTSENLCNFLRDKFIEWNIQNRICAVITDNAPNILSAVRLGGWRSLGCFAHNVNLVVQSSIKFEGFKNILSKVKEVVEYFHRSVQGTKKLREIQAQMNLPELKLKQDVATRWNSTYDMLQRLVVMKDGLIATVALMRNDLIISNEDWDIIEKAIPILKIFYEVTTDISSEKYTSALKVIVYCKIMRNQIERVLEENNEVIKILLKNLKTELTYRFGDIETNMLLAEATILDPRFKSKGFQDVRNYNKALSALKHKICNAAAAVPIPYSEHTTPPQPPQPSHSESSSLWNDFDADVARLVPQNTTAAAIVEIDKYLQEPIIMRKEDPLLWWKARKAVYPLLHSYILKRLNITATSVPCERVFSKAGAILSERRTRLKSKKLSQLIFISCNK